MSVPSGNELGIHIHLIDGDVRKFVQRDLVKARRILDETQPGKLFSEQFLNLAEPSFMTIFPTKSVARVDFIMQGYPAWSKTDILEIVQLTPEAFRMKCRAERGAVEANLTRNIGDPFIGYCEFDMIHGERISAEVRTVVPALAERGVLMTQFAANSVIMIKRLNGGVIFLNQEQIIRMRVNPQPPALINTAIPVNRVTDKEEFEKYEGGYL